MTEEKLKDDDEWISDDNSIVLPSQKAVEKYLESLRKKFGEYQEIGFRRVPKGMVLTK